MIPSSDRIPAFNIAKETLFFDLNSGEDGDCEDNGSLTVLTVVTV